MTHVYSARGLPCDAAGCQLDIARVDRELPSASPAVSVRTRTVSVSTVIPVSGDGLACARIMLTPAEALKVADALKRAAFGYLKELA